MNYIERLNQQFGEALGYVPPRYWNGGTPKTIYCWARASTVTYMGLVRGFYEVIPQLHDGDCWAVAKWDPPISLYEWRFKYGDELAHPQNGMWMLTDFRLPLGEEPTERLTLFAIESAREKLNLKPWEARDISQGIVDRLQRESRRQTDDLIDDACLSYNAVPGTRGGAREFVV